jgi:hypothetical protein
MRTTLPTTEEWQHWQQFASTLLSANIRRQLISPLLLQRDYKPRPSWNSRAGNFCLIIRTTGDGCDLNYDNSCITIPILPDTDL